MKFFKRLNRGALVSLAVATCVLVSSFIVTAQKKATVNEAEEIIESVVWNLFSENAESLIAPSFYGELDTAPISTVVSSMSDAGVSAENVEKVEIDQYGSSYSWHDGDLYAEVSISVEGNKIFGGCSFLFVLREIDGNVKIVFWRNDTAYFYC